MKANKVYLVCMGELVELTQAAYRRYLKTIAEKGCADLGDFGKRLGKVFNVTDVTMSEASIIMDGGYCSNLPRLD